MAEDVDVHVSFRIKAPSGTAATTTIRNKMEAMAPGRPWVLHPVKVTPAGAPGPDGELTSPPWFFHCDVTIKVPSPAPD